MGILAFAPEHNKPGINPDTGRPWVDATGAFRPEMVGFASLHSDSGYRIVDNHRTKQQMRDAILGAIHFTRPTAVAFACHGWTTGIQFGIGLAHIDKLAAELAAGCASVRVALYCCSTGSGPGVGGDGGFADALRDALCAAGAPFCSVDAHDRPGHCTQNRYVRRFEGQGSNVGGTGGAWLVAPGSALWKPWVKALKTTDLRWRFPFMSVAEIHAELQGMK